MEKAKLIKCSRCKKEFESDGKRCCPSCLSERKATYHKKHGFKPTKEDFEERAKSLAQQQQAFSQKFGTSNENCLLFRRIHSALGEHGHEIKEEFLTFYFQHLDSCHDCGKWAKGEGSDLNAVGNKKYEGDENKGYSEVFGDSQPKPLPFGEDKKGWQDMTSQNDPDIKGSLHPKTPQEKEKEPEPLHPCQRYEDPTIPEGSQPEQQQEQQQPEQPKRKPNNPDVDQWLKEHQK